MSSRTPKLFGDEAEATALAEVKEESQILWISKEYKLYIVQVLIYTEFQRNSDWICVALQQQFLK